MSDPILNRAPSFTIGSGLGFAFDVFKARPSSTMLLAGLTLALFLVMGVAGIAPMGLLGAELYAAEQSGQTARVLQLTGQLTLFSLLNWVVMCLVYAWLETVWLTLFVKGRFSLLPGWAVFGRVLISFVLIYAVFFGVYIVLIFILLIPAIMIMAIGVYAWSVAIGVLLFLIGLFALGMIMLRFTAVPAYVVLKDKFLLTRPFSVAGRRWGSLLGSWLVWIVIYYLVMGIGLVISLAIPGSFGAVLGDIFAHLDDPYYQYQAYAGVFSSAGSLALLTLSMLPMHVLMVASMMISRGIGTKLALAIDEEETRLTTPPAPAQTDAGETPDTPEGP